MPKDLYFPTFVGLLSPEHREKIGPALWEFLWFISKTTKEFQDGEELLGIVLGGKPVKVEEIIEDLGTSEKTVRRNISRLKSNGYIESTRAPYGEIYKVRRSKKFKKNTAKKLKSERLDKNDHSLTTEWTHMTERVDTYDHSNKDIKDIKKEEEEEKNMQSNKNELSPKKQIENKYLQRRAHGFDLSPGDEQAINRILADKIPFEKILVWVDEIFNEFKPKHRLDRIKSFKYLEPVILDKWAQEQEQPKVKTGKHKKHNEIDWENI